MFRIIPQNEIRREHMFPTLLVKCDLTSKLTYRRIKIRREHMFPISGKRRFLPLPPKQNGEIMRATCYSRRSFDAMTTMRMTVKPGYGPVSHNSLAGRRRRAAGQYLFEARVNCRRRRRGSRSSSYYYHPLTC